MRARMMKGLRIDTTKEDWEEVEVVQAARKIEAGVEADPTIEVELILEQISNMIP